MRDFIGLQRGEGMPRVRDIGRAQGGVGGVVWVDERFQALKMAEPRVSQWNKG